MKDHYDTIVIGFTASMFEFTMNQHRSINHGQMTQTMYMWVCHEWTSGGKNNNISEYVAQILFEKDTYSLQLFYNIINFIIKSIPMISLRSKLVFVEYIVTIDVINVRSKYLKWVFTRYNIFEMCDKYNIFEVSDKCNIF